MFTTSGASREQPMKIPTSLQFLMAMHTVADLEKKSVVKMLQDIFEQSDRDKDLVCFQPERRGFNIPIEIQSYGRD